MSVLAKKNEDEVKIHVEMTKKEFAKLQKMMELEEKREREEKERQERDQNPAFVQVYKGIGLKAIQWLIKHNKFASEVYIFFINNMNNRNAVVCSQQLLVEEFGKSRQTISKAIKFLSEHNFINVGKIGTSNAYIINPEIAFQDKNSKKKYVSFDGTILLSKEENKELFAKQDYENFKILTDK